MKQPALPVEHRYPWRLTGNELLLELEDDQGRGGIYAFDPRDDNAKPKLLISGGRRPVWNERRTLFAYFHGILDQVWIARRDGYAFFLLGRSSTSGLLTASDPPLFWTQEGNFYMANRTLRFGTTTTGEFCLAPLPDNIDFRQWKKRYLGGSTGPWLRLGKVYDLTQPGSEERIPWTDVYVSRTQSFSPDGKHVAVEIAPALPMDMGRDKSKIYIYRNPARLSPVHENPREVFSRAHHIQGPSEAGRRLTCLGDDVGEMQPMWSPCGRWIAFTIIHRLKSYMAAAVCRPDGSDYCELVVPIQGGKNVYQWQRPAETAERGFDRLSQQWVVWGNLRDMPVGWTSDSMLVISAGFSGIPSLKVARRDKGEWLIRAIPPEVSMQVASAAEDALVTIGPVVGGKHFMAICGIPNLAVTILSVTLDKDEGKLVLLPQDMAVRWIDW